MTEKVIRCKCGCGRRMPFKKLKEGIVFYNENCEQWYNKIGKNLGKKRRQYRYPSRYISKPKDTVEDRYSYNGNKYCKNYQDDNICCVMCYENGEKKYKSCKG